ncbi:hypothetical protein QVD17_36469 [Tagetes erecta]|uniref:Uncharacterized protein n=1 Tax=Tagetes erecta TaxID=13708 RepID=A0AAD8NJ90_TARER|nr:hypothetical protein QVD17_36469 [Tagetes erecta]
MVARKEETRWEKGCSWTSSGPWLEEKRDGDVVNELWLVARSRRGGTRWWRGRMSLMLVAFFLFNPQQSVNPPPTAFTFFSGNPPTPSPAISHSLYQSTHPKNSPAALKSKHKTVQKHGSHSISLHHRSSDPTPQPRHSNIVQPRQRCAHS